MGIEPTSEGFADLSLTTWVPRPEAQYSESWPVFQRVISSRGLKMGNCDELDLQPSPMTCTARRTLLRGR